MQSQTCNLHVKGQEILESSYTAEKSVKQTNTGDTVEVLRKSTCKRTVNRGQELECSVITIKMVDFKDEP